MFLLAVADPEILKGVETDASGEGHTQKVWNWLHRTVPTCRPVSSGGGRRGRSVVRTSVFGWRTFPAPHPICSWHV